MVLLKVFALREGLLSDPIMVEASNSPKPLARFAHWRFFVCSARSNKFGSAVNKKSPRFAQGFDSFGGE
jgi:hypothetical protein